MSRYLVLGLAILPVGCGVAPATGDEKPVSTAPAKFAEARAPKVDADKFDGERCLKYLKQVCDLGPRISGSEAMAKQVELLDKHFTPLGGKVAKQEFQAKQNSRRDKTAMTNLVVSWHPDRKQRLILCTHYDTRPQADQEADRTKWDKPFVSANDGGSGIALFMELAHVIKDWPTEFGVDFVFFDGEEYVFGGPDGRDRYFLGSQHFASQHQGNKAADKPEYKAAINFDMVGHDGAKLNIEGHSFDFAPNLVMEFWTAAAGEGAKSFRDKRGFNRSFNVEDDHISLQNVGIPAIDVIDFDYEHWHKVSDTPDKCTAKQLAEVGRTTLAWLKTKPRK